MANEPRSYREVLALALEAARPQAEVVIAEPVALDLEVRRFVPRLVICSRVTSLVEDEIPAWVELYREHGPDSTISIGGRRSKVSGMEMQDLLRIFDQTRSLLPGIV